MADSEGRSFAVNIPHYELKRDFVQFGILAASGEMAKTTRASALPIQSGAGSFRDRVIYSPSALSIFSPLARSNPVQKSFNAATQATEC